MTEEPVTDHIALWKVKHRLAGAYSIEGDNADVGKMLPNASDLQVARRLICCYEMIHGWYGPLKGPSAIEAAKRPALKEIYEQIAQLWYEKHPDKRPG